MEQQVVTLVLDVSRARAIRDVCNESVGALVNRKGLPAGMTANEMVERVSVCRDVVDAINEQIGSGGAV